MDDFKNLPPCDDSTTYANVGHVIHRDYGGNRGPDRCLQFFGEESDECVAYNLKYETRG